VSIKEIFKFIITMSYRMTQ